MLSSAAVAMLVRQPRSRQRELVGLIQRLSHQPDQPGDYAIPDEHGRPVQFILIGSFIIGYWPDHATCELRIVTIDEV